MSKVLWATGRGFQCLLPGESRVVGFWRGVDRLGHRLRIPRSVLRPVCDRYDIAAGVPREDLIEMDYAGRPVPWWLRW